MQNKKLAELFKQKFLLERERNEENKKVLKDFLWGVVNICSLSVFFLISRRIFQGSDEFSQSLGYILLWISPCLFFFLILTIFFYYNRKILHRQRKKINEIEQKIIEELTKE